MDEYSRRELERMSKFREEIEKAEKLQRDIDPLGEELRRLGIRSPHAFESSSEYLIRLVRGIHSDSALEKVLQTDLHLLKTVEDARRQVEIRDKLYRVPGVYDKLWLATEIELTLKKYPDLSFGLTQSQLEFGSNQLQYPWLSTTDGAASVRAFVEFQAMAAAVNALPPFSDELATTLRTVLGDWRDSINVPAENLFDASARIEFYVQRGYDPAVADVPPDAFNERIELAGFLDDDDPLDFDGAPDATSVKRTNDAHYHLLCFENQIRRFIEREMLKAAGEKWIKQRVPELIRKQWADKQAEAHAKGELALPLFDNSDFGHYVDIICRTDNWDGVFKQFFRRQETVREFFNEVIPVRNAVSHGRPIVQDDWVFLRVNLKRLRKLIS